MVACMRFNRQQPFFIIQTHDCMDSLKDERFPTIFCHYFGRENKKSQGFLAFIRGSFFFSWESTFLEEWLRSFLPFFLTLFSYKIFIFPLKRLHKFVEFNNIRKKVEWYYNTVGKNNKYYEKAKWNYVLWTLRWLVMWSQFLSDMASADQKP